MLTDQTSMEEVCRCLGGLLGVTVSTVVTILEGYCAQARRHWTRHWTLEPVACDGRKGALELLSAQRLILVISAELGGGCCHGWEVVGKEVNCAAVDGTVAHTQEAGMKDAFVMACPPSSH
ncbi:hypothetical protein N2152v2_009729 [Parachlorella kessleri]